MMPQSKSSNPHRSESDSEPDAETPLDAGLYIVATPIGNLGDITIRAIDTLRRTHLIACEDTRVTGRLLKAHDIDTRMQRYDDHSSSDTRARLIEMARTQAIALVSDAGTPLISDPGHRLVEEARGEGIAITSLPGACAAIVGMTLSGLPNDRFLFAGFLPVKEKARREQIERFADVPATLVFYETGPRLEKSLRAIAQMFPTREIAVARELTKLHEECRTGTAAELADHYAARPPKGEIVLLIGPPDDAAPPANADELLREALIDLSPSKAAAQVAKATGRDRQTLYARAVEIRNEDTGR